MKDMQEIRLTLKELEKNSKQLLKLLNMKLPYFQNTAELDKVIGYIKYLDGYLDGLEGTKFGILADIEII